MFTSRSSLWANLDCVGSDKTRTYLERSKSSPINLSLNRDDDLSPYDPFFQTDPNAIGRLRSLSIEGAPWNLQDITAHLSHPAPLLEDMLIDGNYGREREPEDGPVLASTLFNGDLSSLRKLHLHSVCTDLPWKNMVNLTSFTLAFASPISMRLLLDFFESAPHLREVELYSTTLISAAQNGRLVSLACLKRMYTDDVPPSALLDHLLIPLGAHLTTDVNLPSPPIKGHPPKFLDNLRNLPNFTTIRLTGGPNPQMEFRGPNGEVCIYLVTPLGGGSCLSLEFLALFDTSKTKWLNIDLFSPSPSGPPHRALVPMNDLHTLTLSRCLNPESFIQALHPSMSPSVVLVCPKLEELVVEHRGSLDIKVVIRMAAARASSGAKLRSIRIFDWYETTYPQRDVLELEKHVLHVECGREVDEIGSDSDDSDEEDSGEEDSGEED